MSLDCVCKGSLSLCLRVQLNKFDQLISCDNNQDEDEDKKQNQYSGYGTGGGMIMKNEERKHTNEAVNYHIMKQEPTAELLLSYLWGEKVNYKYYLMLSSPISATLFRDRNFR
jgi:hypothetical protein